MVGKRLRFLRKKSEKVAEITHFARRDAQKDEKSITFAAEKATRCTRGTFLTRYSGGIIASYMSLPTASWAMRKRVATLCMTVLKNFGAVSMRLTRMPSRPFYILACDASA